MKKHQKANLEERRGVFFQIGLIAALAVTLVSFEWTNYTKSAAEADCEIMDSHTMAEIIRPHKVPEPPKPKEFKPKMDLNIPPKIVPVPVVGEPAPDPDIDKFFLELGDDGLGGICEDCPPENEQPIPASSLQNKPYYLDCSSDDLEQQSNCSYHTIKNHVMQNCKYPEILREAGMQGRVWISFVVDKKGNIVEVEAVRGDHDLFKKAAIKAVETVPALQPGTKLGKPVLVQFMIPVDFKLAD